MHTNHSKPTDQALLDLILVGRVNTTYASIVAANLQAVIGINTDIGPTIAKPHYAYMPGRGQYNADRILKELSEMNDGAPFKLGLIEYDLCTPILTFVYGESQLGGKAALVSLHRLLADDPTVAYQRAVKISLHEVGHLLGIGHCWSLGCLMRFSSNMEALDSLSTIFCSTCEYEIKRRLKTLMNSLS